MYYWENILLGLSFGIVFEYLRNVWNNNNYILWRKILDILCSAFPPIWKVQRKSFQVQKFKVQSACLHKLLVTYK